jgi:hypothetical protein
VGKGMNFFDYITSNALILVPVLYIIGMILKSTPKVLDWAIPYILLPFGIFGTIGLIGCSLDSVIQGILVTGATVYINQLIKQASNSRSADNSNGKDANTGTGK